MIDEDGLSHNVAPIHRIAESYSYIITFVYESYLSEILASTISIRLPEDRFLGCGTSVAVGKVGHVKDSYMASCLF